MQLQKKIGIGFILLGFFLGAGTYFVTNGGAFVFSALIGLMAIFFGAFQLMISTDIPAKKQSSPKSRTKKAKT
jgi:hypothetical protein